MDLTHKEYVLLNSSEALIATLEAKRRTISWMMPVGVLVVFLSFIFIWLGIIEQSGYMFNAGIAICATGLGLVIYRVWQEFLCVAILFDERARLKNKKMNQDLDEHLRMMAMGEQVTPQAKNTAKVLTFRGKRRA